MKTMVKAEQAPLTGYQPVETLRVVMSHGQPTPGPGKSTASLFNLGLSLVLAALSVAALASNVTAASAARAFLGPSPGETYVYDANGLQVTLQGLRWSDEDTVLVRETYAVPPELIAQGFGEMSDRVFKLKARGGALSREGSGQEVLMLDVELKAWDMFFESYEMTETDEHVEIATSIPGEKKYIPGRCEITSEKKGFVFNGLRTILTVECQAIGFSSDVHRKIYASGIGLIESGVAMDGKYSQSQLLVDIQGRVGED